MTINTSSLSAGLTARATLLAALVGRPVDTNLLWQVRDDYFGTQWARSTPEAKRGLALLRESAAVRETVERLNHDYERLFGPEGRIRLEESVHTGLNPRHLEAYYGAFGFERFDGLAPDHLATELRFLAHLAGVGNETELPAFTREHLRPWAPECFAEITMRAGSLYYQGVGALGMDFIESLAVR